MDEFRSKEENQCPIFKKLFIVHWDFKKHKRGTSYWAKCIYLDEVHLLDIYNNDLENSSCALRNIELLSKAGIGLSVKPHPALLLKRTKNKWTGQVTWHISVQFVQ